VQVGAYINLVCDADEQKAVNLARTGAGLVSHFAGMKIAENLKTQNDMAHHAQEKGSHLGMIDDEFVRWMAICGTPSLCIDKLSVLLDMGLQHIYLLGGTPYEGPPGKRITGIVDVAELFATDVVPQIRKDHGAS
jgi:alkanesulfonate monooxygenase SsuD/methylene tetrahydromethanopterin reductase-like flavin-dependent oxidoreductase (luciferase family)